MDAKLRVCVLDTVSVASLSCSPRPGPRAAVGCRVLWPERSYAKRLGEILETKMSMCRTLQTQLEDFRRCLREEEEASRRVDNA